MLQHIPPKQKCNSFNQKQRKRSVKELSKKLQALGNSPCSSQLGSLDRRWGWGWQLSEKTPKNFSNNSPTQRGWKDITSHIEGNSRRNFPKCKNPFSFYLPFHLNRERKRVEFTILKTLAERRKERTRRILIIHI